MSKIYTLIVNSDNGFQVILNDKVPQELLPKNLYKPYSKQTMDCLLLDLDKGKKITDILKVGTLNLDGFPVITKVFNILKKHNQLEIQFVDIINDDLNDFKFMFFNSDLTNQLDYNKCDFFLVEDILGDITELDIKIKPNRDAVIEAYRNFCVENIFIKLLPRNGYHFLNKFNIKEFDMFRIGYFDKSFYVSEKLKNELENNKITGVEFEEQSYFRNP